MKTKSCLIIEDVPTKYDDVHRIAANVLTSWRFVHAKSVVEAQDLAVAEPWDLIILDISMDISAAPGGIKSREAHANTGGLDIVEQMYLLELVVPTVIVTGFDYFIRSDRDSEVREAQTFADLEVQAKRWLGDKLLACIRYGKPGWDKTFDAVIQGVSQ